VFQKGKYDLEGNTMPDITAEEFRRWTRDIWFIPPRSDDKHPAVFPIELPLRLIKLYSYPEQTIMDPFMGIGTTGIAAVRRQFVGFEISRHYCNIAVQKINEYCLGE
jgi:site-specific DNA-methyltransferase (adenine-specific)